MAGDPVFGKWLRATRKAKKVRAKVLADSVGRAVEMIYLYETGVVLPQASYVATFEALLGEKYPDRLLRAVVDDSAEDAGESAPEPVALDDDAKQLLAALMARCSERPDNAEISMPFVTAGEVHALAAVYNYDGDDALGASLVQARARGWMIRDELVSVAAWKWRGARPQQLAMLNSEGEVQEITRASFSAESERLRIGALLALSGVHWPMASVILHFAFRDRYPILDVRAMASVGGLSSYYSHQRWIDYVTLCREAVGRLGVTMRDLDRALWVLGGYVLAADAATDDD